MVQRSGQTVHPGGSTFQTFQGANIRTRTRRHPPTTTTDDNHRRPLPAKIDKEMYPARGNFFCQLDLLFGFPFLLYFVLAFKFLLNSVGNCELGGVRVWSLKLVIFVVIYVHKWCHKR